MYVPLLNYNRIFKCNTLSWREDLGKDQKPMCAAFHLFNVLKICSGSLLYLSSLLVWLFFPPASAWLPSAFGELLTDI